MKAQPISIYGIVMLVVGFILVIGWIMYWIVLFLHLSRSHKKYYKSIGSPILRQYMIDAAEPKRSYLALQYMFVWTIKGVPKKFPDDKLCHKLTVVSSLRYFFIGGVVFWIVGAALFSQSIAK